MGRVEGPLQKGPFVEFSQDGVEPSTEGRNLEEEELFVHYKIPLSRGVI